MKRTTLWFGLGALVAFGSGSLTWADQTTPVRGLHQYDPNLIAFTNATIIPEPGKKIESATLVIENGLIKNVAKGLRAPAGARVIDATGYTIYPGFIDPYSNYGVTKPEQSGPLTRGQMPQYSNAREGGNASNAAIHAEKNWYESAKPNKSEANRYIDLGFTAVQTARLDGIFRGRAATLSLADKIPNDILYQPKARHFASFDKGSSKQQYPSSLMGSVALIRQALSDAAWYKEAYGLTSSNGAVEYNAALAALANLSQEGVVFEASDELNLLRAARLFKEFSTPITVVGSGYEYARLNEIKQSGATLVLPLNYPAAPSVTAQYSELDVPLADLRHWERAPGNLAAVSEAGIKFAVTSYGLDNKADFWPNLRKAVNYGLSKDSALAALTTVAADVAGISSQAGRLQQGYRADLVVTRGDIFENGDIVSVWLQGQEKKLSAMHPAQFAGVYDFNIQGHAAQLSLVGDKALKGTLITPEGEVTVRHLNVSADKVQFVAELASLSTPGTYRFELTQLNQTEFSVQLVDTKGQPSVIVATRADKVGQAEQASIASAPPVYTSQLTWPNTGFGSQQKPQQQNVHFKNATIWTSDSQGVLHEADLIIRNGLIYQIGTNLKTPRGYEVIDATDMHITPGFIDEHSHIAISQGVNEGTEAVTAEAHIGDVVNPDDIHIYRSLAGGVTVAHLLHGSANPIGATGQAIKLRWGEGAEGLKFKEVPPTIKMALGENVKQSNWGDMNRIRYPQTRMGVAAIMRDYFQQAREYEAAKKKYANLSRSERKRTAPPRTDYRMETLLQIINNERHTHVHSYVASEILALMDVVEQLGFRIHTFTHVLEGYKVADAMKAHGARASTFADWWAYKFEAYDAVSQNACLMMEKGILTTVNSDSNDLQRRLNTEAAKSVRYCGMSEEDALKMVTLYPAMQLEVADYVGSIRTGKQADVVLWNNHPLSAYAQVQQTWIEGKKYFDRQADRQRRAEIEQERALLVEQILQQGIAAQQGAKGTYKQPQPTWHCEDNHDTWRWHELSQASLMTELGGVRL